MRQFEAKKLYPGSDIVRGYTYIFAASLVQCALFSESDGFGCCSPRILCN